MKKTPLRWFPVIQERADYNRRFPEDDFRAYRKFSVWPISFATCAECDEFIFNTFTFANLPSARKRSVSSMNQAQLRNVTVPGQPYRRYV